MITLPKFKRVNPYAVHKPWYIEDEFYMYQWKRGYNTNGCIRLKHEIQDCIKI